MNDQEYKTHISRWFEIMEGNGEKTEILFFQQSGPTSSITEFSHKEYDGIGALAELNLRLGGDHLVAPKLKILHPTWRIIIGLFNYLKESGLYFFPWRRKENKKWGQVVLPLGFDLEGVLFEKCLSYCKSQDISLNTLLIKLFNQALFKIIPDHSTQAKWLIPINMRGYINQTRSNAHHSSYIVIRCWPNEKAQAIHSQIKWQLAHGLHYFSWWGLFIAKILGKEAPRKIMNNYHNKRHSWAGTISNLGNWSGNELEKHHWYFCPPVTYAHPLAIGIIEFKSRVSIGILIHHSLEQADSLADQIKNLFNEQLLNLN